MIAFLKRLFGTASDGARRGSTRRSVTADVLANGPRTPAKSKPRAAASSTGTADEKFDPYNTGKFDRSASWERISRSQR
jgi:hypothetical protein